ncbi:xanthine dehydrogenase accessory protein XdhC [Acerihabitans arboris]|uniref:Xanthine dehydrogenase accessory protein XdhC n=1 Tax=Acerihabitans arboris TaxID=2691583 RepID=A0A845SIQ3_9GAMM|nr:xanthine dehydrogenase accessory protein XdhC [Acerihabitans arboris]NDL63147.1 xanthine dehydrogenase accessory protein XdhC [Acerihabitans arboris]
MSDNWIFVLAQLQANRTPSVLATVIDDRGSTPRDSGTKMVVTADRQFCTVGGGHLEFQCARIAREMLGETRPGCRTERFSLGARLGQCCGGVTTVLFEPVIVALPHIALFGAGHVGKALVRILAGLPCDVSWVDSRGDQFPPQVDEHIKVIIDDPLDALDAVPADSYFIVMTHDHQLDFKLIEQILKRGEYRYCGLIGSATKRRRFCYRLGERGIGPDALARLRCPIGLEEVKGKMPAEIAVAIAGEIISRYNRLAALATDNTAACLEKRAG